MNSITKKISLLILLSAVLFLSSCLDSGDNSYIGHDEYSYITQSETGVIYANTASGHLITSQGISSKLNPGDIALLSFEVTDETETIPIGNNLVIYKVNLGGEPTILDQERLHPISAPAKEDTVYFESIIAPPVWLTNSSQYFGDRWPLTYQYKAKKGENVSVVFYTVHEDDLPENLNADILIDIRLEKSGTPEANAKEELKNDLVVVNLSDLRYMHSEVGEDGVYKEMKVKFRFFRSDNKNELYISDRPISIKI